MDGPVFPSPFPGNFGGPLRSSEYPNTVPCSPHCNDGETLQWESVFPQGNYSVGQGFVGQRVCSFKGTQPDLRDALRDIMATHWPEPMDWCPDCLPVNVQFGAAQNASPLGNIPDSDIGHMLEGFTQYRIVVTYQLLRISDPWPPFGKPDHPQGTILTLQVRGGGEILQIDPTALAGGNGLNLTGCYVGTEPAINNAFNSRIRIPLTEYHITCDRLTDAQLCSIMTYVPWKCREGTVNYEGDPESFGNPPFLGEREGTLMFDTWTLSPTYAPDVDNPRRWQLSCVLKCRQIPGVCGPYPSDCSSAKYPVGWNHDYKKGVKSGAFGWQFIMMHMPGNWTSKMAETPHGNCPKPMVPRYPYMTFSQMFCGANEDCLTGLEEPSADCTNTCEANTCPPATGEKGSEWHEEDAELEQRIAQIVDESRKAKSRATWRHSQEEQAGFVERWPESSKP